MWLAIIALGQHTRSGNIKRGMPKYHLDNTHGLMTSCMAYIIDLGQHIRSDEVGYGMASSSLDCTHGPTMLGVACNHGLQNAQMVGRRRAWHAIVALGQYIGSNDVGHGMPSLTLENTHDRRHQALPAIKALAKYT